MTVQATEADAACAIKIEAMAEGAGRLDRSGGIMEGGVRPSPVGGMDIVDPMTPLATSSVDPVDADIETGIASRSACLAMAVLADGQIGLGIRAMVCPAQIGTIQGVRHMARTVWVTAEAIERGGKTAGSCRAAE